MKILVTGGTGFLGSALIESLLAHNHEIILISRKSTTVLGTQPYRVIHWPITSAEENDAILACDAVIHLAGESIAGARWTKEKKIKTHHQQNQKHVEWTIK